MDLLGIDIGGTKISVSLGNEKGEITHSERLSTPSFKTGDEALEAVFSLSYSLLKKKNLKLHQISAIGISSPGPIDSKRGMMLNPPNLKGWENTPLVQKFKETFQRPVFMNNDANAAALAEYLFGGSKGVDLVYLTLSTGIGGGIVIGGKLLQGASDTAGEVGHYVLDIHGPSCPCGLRGCFEVYCGGAQLAKRIQERIIQENIFTQLVKEAIPIDKINVQHLIEAVRKKDPLALSIWDEFIERLAQGIGIVLMCFNPQALILGTIAIHAQELLLNPLRSKLTRFAWKQPIRACHIAPSILGDNLSALSAFAVALAGLNSKE